MSIVARDLPPDDLAAKAQAFRESVAEKTSQLLARRPPSRDLLAELEAVDAAANADPDQADEIARHATSYLTTN